jgi:UDP-glucose 4-epimerase
LGGASLVVGLTGPTGHLGGLLLDRLRADPDVAEVRSVARRPLPPAGGPGARLVHVCADLRDGAARRAVEGVDIVYHLAAQVWEGRGATAREEMRAVNVDGTHNVLAASAAPVVLASSAAVYGAWPDNPLPLDEAHEARPNPECPYAAHKLAAEQVCTAEVRCWAIVRLAAVLGPHADGRVARAVHGYRLVVPAVRGAPQAVQWLDEDDAVDGLLAAGRDLLGGRRAQGQVVNVATADWLSSGDAAGVAASRALELPRRVLLGVSELGRRLGLSPFGADRAALIDGPLALSVTKAERLLGWRPTRTSAQVLSAALQRDWRRAPRQRPL